MILGDRCSRNCGFCNVANGDLLPPDPQEAIKVAKAIAELKLRHAVVTSVTRDDLPDGGAAQFAELVQAVRHQAPNCKTELLIPDLQGDLQALATILESRPDILGHNLETVPRLYQQARQGAIYQRSLDILEHSRKIAPSIPTKSGLMLGMGEEVTEVKETLRDLCNIGCTMLTLGQYLSPSRNHLPVVRYVTPDEFSEYKSFAETIGFAHVESGPLVRSSYHAEKQLMEAEHGDNL